MIAATTLGSIKVADSGEYWDGDRLRTEIARRANVLQAAGARAGDVLLLHQGGSPGFFADLFAAWKIGACAACTNPGLKPGELANVARFIEPRLILVGEDGATAAVAGVETMNTARKDSGQAATPGAGAGLDAPALILFTSGTTGTPKGVVHTFRSLIARVALNRAHIGDEVLRNTLCVLPVHFGHGLIGNCLTPLLAGSTLVLAPGTDIKRAAAIGRLVSEHGISFMSSVPALWRMILRVSEAPRPGGLLQVNVGSAPLSAELWKRIIAWTGTRNVVNMYGITETANWLGGASAAEFAPEDGLIGRMWGGTMAVLDDAGELHATGEGELLVQSPSLMSGYHQLPELTGGVLRGGWFHTGDIGRIDSEGVARLTGRIKHEINRGGIKVHPEDVDLLLERHPDVAEACTFGMPDEISGEIVGVAVRLDPAASATPESLRDWCGERLRREAVPERWFVVDEIPKTDRGKVNRENVMKHCLSRSKRA